MGRGQPILSSGKKLTGEKTDHYTGCQDSDQMAQDFLVHFDDQYWVMFTMAKSMFFPQFQGENSQGRKNFVNIL